MSPADVGAPGDGDDPVRPVARVRRNAVSRFVLLYAPLALGWIIVSDFLIAAFLQDIQDALWLSVLKGTMFVVLTTWLFDLVMRRTMKEVDHQRVLFQAVVERAPDLILRATLVPTLRFDYVSPASRGIAGYGPEELYADPDLVLKSVHPEDAAELTQILTQPSLARTSVELRFLHKKDGSVVWTDTDLKWETDEAGHPVGIVAVVRNTSERHETQDRVLLLATAVEAAGEAVMVTDDRGSIVYVNPSFERLSGYTGAELIGQNPRVLKSGRQNERFYARLWSTLRSGGTFRGRFVNRAKDGRLYEQRTTITPVSGPGGRVSHFVAVARDVTVEREIHRQIAAAEKSAAVAELAAGMAHDFRNLLNVVTVNVELLSAGAMVDSDAAQSLSDIERSAKAGADLVTRLLQLSRPSEASRSLLYLGPMVADLEGVVRASATKAIEVSFRMEPEIPPVYVARGQIEQAVLNLVRNASQAMPTGGSLTLTVGRAERLPHDADPDHAPDGFLRLAVADTGVGMDVEGLAHVYDPYYTTKESGTGLGVPMVRQAAVDHGGYLEFESSPGRGTVASMYLPVAEEPLLVEESTARGMPEAAPRGTERVLVVDDDSALRKATQRALTQLGYDVETVDGGLAAIRKVEEGSRWDLILTDLVMPGLSGDELYHRLQERDIRIPVVFVSGRTPGLIDLTSGTWPTGFLQKPWSVESLAAAVRAGLDAH